MKSLLENTKILAVVTALFGVCMIMIGRADFFASMPLFVVGGVFCVAVGIAIFRPAFGFALFISALPFEIISVLPENVGLSVRPYQLLGVALCCAILWIYVRRDVTITDVRASIMDFLVGIFLLVSFMTVRWAVDPSLALQQTIILASFVVLYFVSRFFVTDVHRVIAVLPIIVVSGGVMSVYAIVQNILFLQGGDHQEFMPGRPNAFFAEPDWLGVYFVFVFAACIAYLYYNAHHKHVWRFFDVSLWSVTTTVAVAMILTVARSAWVGVASVSAVYLLVVFLSRKYKMFARHALWLGSVAVVSMGVVLYAPVTNFELDNRIQSTTTGLQEITVSCTQESAGAQLSAQKEIDDVAELSAYGCRHIDLEEIEKEKMTGHTVVKVLRNDPNVAVRAKTYDHVIQLVRARPFTGYGWGSSGDLLGNDEQGTPLNASNIFLETALSIGVIGLGVLVLFFGAIGVRALHVMYCAHDEVTRSVAVFSVIGLVAIIVPNLFNAGLFLGFVWVYFALVAPLFKKI
ncbi:MAG: O-antigen ligase family protein [Parcubacteria group bacterium]|jgi:hypothetical protein